MPFDDVSFTGSIPSTLSLYSDNEDKEFDVLSSQSETATDDTLKITPPLKRQKNWRYMCTSTMASPVSPPPENYMIDASPPPENPKIDTSPPTGLHYNAHVTKLYKKVYFYGISGAFWVI
jgi:hypothetical protein